MTEDLSRHHRPVSDLFPKLNERSAYALSDDQVAFYEEYGYLAGVKMLTDEQIEALREEVAALADPAHPGHELFYEFNANESADPQQILFHALGAWRSSRVCTICCGTPHLSFRRGSCWVVQCASGTIRSSISPRVTAAS
jgi:hypothetical protein